MKISLSKMTGLILIIVLFIGQIDSFGDPKKKRKKKIVEKAVLVQEWRPEKGSDFSKATEELPKVDKVQVFRVGGSLYDNLEKLRSGTEIPIKSFHIPVSIISSKTLLNDEAEEFVRTWRKILRGEGSGCISPAYKVEFFAQDNLLLEVDICFHCSNIFINLTDSKNPGIWGFNATGNSGKDLLIKLKELLPEK